jgi:hypothetical protein
VSRIHIHLNSPVEYTDEDGATRTIGPGAVPAVDYFAAAAAAMRRSDAPEQREALKRAEPTVWFFPHIPLGGQE